MKPQPAKNWKLRQGGSHRRSDLGESNRQAIVRDARFAETGMYDAGSLTGMEGDKEFVVHWMDPNAPAHNRSFYSEGLFSLIGTD